MAQVIGNANPRGSVWRRWDPHIHSPGTLFSDQFKGDWNQYLTLVENSTPPIRALGVTDYYFLDCYEQVVQYKLSGRLASVELIFPNVELRLAIGTDSGSAINVHLLISPEDPNHVEEAKRFLRLVQFRAYDDVFRCEREEFIRLGRIFDKTIVDDVAALRAGATQFKVPFEKLREAWDQSEWAKSNILVAAAAGSNDGTSGLQSDSSFATLRKEIEKFSKIILSGNPKQREFWLGKGAASPQVLQSKWDGLKPCIHGSDAHSLEKVGAPDDGRLCWIKGDATFEALRQACIEPDDRCYVGVTPPTDAIASQVIASVGVSEAPWFQTNPVLLNRGLVGIIGARGSGKTALADMIAAGAFALSPTGAERSFIQRAWEHVMDCTTALEWEEGESTEHTLSDDEDDFVEAPRARYLSQHFVDKLCSAEGLTDELRSEIERVIYQAHPLESRMGTTTFPELLAMRASRGRSMRQRQEELLAQINAEYDIERQRHLGLRNLERQRAELATAVANDKNARVTLLGKNTSAAAHAKALEGVSNASELVRLRIDRERRRRQSLLFIDRYRKRNTPVETAARPETG